MSIGGEQGWTEDLEPSQLRRSEKIVCSSEDVEVWPGETTIHLDPAALEEVEGSTPETGRGRELQNKARPGPRLFLLSRGF